MNNTVNKITEGNAFALNIRQAVWRTLGGVIQPLQASELVDVHLYVGSGSSKSTATEYPVTADGDTISAVMPATLKRGVYRTWLTALYQGREVASACECAFEIVPFDERKGVFAPERIDGEPCVYLQGVSMSDAELEAQKTYYRALIKQKEDEIALLAKEREKLTNVALQLDGVDESLDGISETLDGVAKEDTQQEIKKALDLVKAEISVEDKLNIRAAIELKGGQSVYKNPENPALLELANNVGTIPQKFLTLEPEGVRYDDPIEWHAFNKDVADAVDAARSLQNKIDAEGGIQSILHSDVKYKGFILFEYTTAQLDYDSAKNSYYIQLSYSFADAYLLAYEAPDRCLIERNTYDGSRIYLDINLEGVANYGHFFIFYLYKEDGYTANIDSLRSPNYFFNIVIGGHPSSVSLKLNSDIKGSFIQLNVTEKTDYTFDSNMYLNMIYTRNKRGNMSMRRMYRVYLEQYEESNSNIITGECYYLYALKLRRCSENGHISLSNITYLELGIEDGGFSGGNVLRLSLPNLKSCTGRYFLNNLPLLTAFDAPQFEEMYSTIDASKGGLMAMNRIIKRFYLPNFKKLEASTNHYMFYDNIALEEIYLPKFATFTSPHTSRIAYKCSKLKRVILPKLNRYTERGTMAFELCESIKKIVLGNVESNTAWGCVGANDLIHFEFAETLEYSINMTNWRPTNAINATISTLVEDGEEFANNREKFLWNFRNYIIAMLHDYSGTRETRTLTLHNMVANVLTDDDKMAITNKGWILSIV